MGYTIIGGKIYTVPDPAPNSGNADPGDGFDENGDPIAPATPETPTTPAGGGGGNPEFWPISQTGPDTWIQIDPSTGLRYGYHPDEPAIGSPNNPDGTPNPNYVPGTRATRDKTPLKGLPTATGPTAAGNALAAGVPQAIAAKDTAQAGSALALAEHYANMDAIAIANMVRQGRLDEARNMLDRAKLTGSLDGQETLDSVLQRANIAHQQAQDALAQQNSMGYDASGKSTLQRQIEEAASRRADVATNLSRQGQAYDQFAKDRTDIEGLAQHPQDWLSYAFRSAGKEPPTGVGLWDQLQQIGKNRPQNVEDFLYGQSPEGQAAKAKSDAAAQSAGNTFSAPATPGSTSSNPNDAGYAPPSSASTNAANEPGGVPPVVMQNGPGFDNAGNRQGTLAGALAGVAGGAGGQLASGTSDLGSALANQDQSSQPQMKVQTPQGAQPTQPVPVYDLGGVVPGTPDQHSLAVVQGGETMTPANLGGNLATGTQDVGNALGNGLSGGFGGNLASGTEQVGRALGGNPWGIPGQQGSAELNNLPVHTHGPDGTPQYHPHGAPSGLPRADSPGGPAQSQWLPNAYDFLNLPYTPPRLKSAMTAYGANTAQLPEGQKPWDGSGISPYALVPQGGLRPLSAQTRSALTPSDLLAYSTVVNQTGNWSGDAQGYP